MDRTKILSSVALTALSVLLISCSRTPTIVVGSKNFTEQVLLGEILAQQIEHRLNVRVERKLDLGGTLIAHEALVKGAIDLYPEYTGTALTAILKRPASSDASAALATVREAYRGQWRLAWLDPFGFNNTFAMIVRRDENLSTLSAAAAAHPWRLGAGYEFRQRPDGLDGLLQTYRLRLAGEPAIMDLGLLYSALQNRQVDLIAANSTDGQISIRNVTVLKDDRMYFPPYECAAVVRQEAMDRFPALSGALGELSGKLPEAAMRQLNYQVDGQHRRPADVAAEFLRNLERR
jgi:osmoprotectant transport system substrate-binding protein